MTPARLARLTPYVYILPAAVVMLAGLAWPIADAVRLSFYDWPLGTDWTSARWVGLEAFGDMLRSRGLDLDGGDFRLRRHRRHLRDGAGYRVGTLPGETGARHADVRTVFVLPMMIAPICVGLIWRYLFDANFGPIHLWSGALGFAPRAWLAEPELAFLAIVITDIWQWTPFVLIMVLAALQGIDASVIEAARIDGANAWQQIVRVKLPVIQPILVVTLLMRMIDGFRGLEVVYVMTLGGPGQSTELFSLHIYKAAFISQKLGYSAALSILLLCIVAVLALAVLLIANPLRPRGAR